MPAVSAAGAASHPRTVSNSGNYGIISTLASPAEEGECRNFSLVIHPCMVDLLERW